MFVLSFERDALRVCVGVCGCVCVFGIVCVCVIIIIIIVINGLLQANLYRQPKAEIIH